MLFSKLRYFIPKPDTFFRSRIFKLRSSSLYKALGGKFGRKKRRKKRRTFSPKSMICKVFRVRKSVEKSVQKKRSNITLLALRLYFGKLRKGEGNPLY